MDHKTVNIMQPKDLDHGRPGTPHEKRRYHNNPDGTRLSSQYRGSIPQKNPKGRKGSKGQDAAPGIHHAQAGRIHTPDRTGTQQAVFHHSALADARHADGNHGQVRREEDRCRHKA